MPLKNALVVEDNPVNQLYLSRLLSGMGFRVSLAPNGQEGIRAFLSNLFDVVFMDVHMPVMDGIQSTRGIREKNAKVPILMVTTDDSEDIRIQARQAGANEYIYKPVEPEDLREALNRVHVF
jgi:CheY-like chemotaxis protein